MTDLIERLRAHAALHRGLGFDDDDEQAQWARDLLTAADEIERLTAERDDLRRQLDECSQMLARQAATIRDLESKLRSADAAERSINEALNSGDGSYRP